MQVFVKSLQGNTLALDVSTNSSVAAVKAMIQEREGLPVDAQLLSFAGKPLVDGELALYGIANNNTLNLNAELLGGGKKRKKKTYTTPRRSSTSVDESGKVTRLRRECPNATCGAGVFMAKHKDRQYCGKCHLTYVFQKGESA
ncbi:ribosomal protein S27a-domain-containing protein [Gilbertella persicaria]|uniref:ribosomal protein S27a-domain-containing protein n=1 Tax=Gilbertella persicaria TaxID=101096 RepID=UPI0022205E5F|nr:ribosomal protein S27a-domain-containing protein [Gilbertella persicaria]KAI8078090.1 ribosomal protein S27a-domain-containing protein [Gilbertella persicaria]